MSSKNKQLNYDIGDYMVSNKLIGKGSFSSIFLGTSKYNNENVYAIKKMNVDNIKKLSKNIKREIELHQQFNHRNIIKIYDVIYDDTLHNNHIYLVLEYCKQGDFHTFQNKRPIREYYIKKYVNDLSGGLKYLYKLKIVHRDLKTKNLLISDCGDIKIADFGFAKIYNEDKVNPDLKQTYCGSPLYMAPEILYYQKYDNKSDLWSVGIIIYEMITGNPPYHVKNFYQLMKELDKGDITFPVDYKTVISQKLQTLLNSLLIKEPQYRLSWSEFFSNDWICNNKLHDENGLLNITIGGCKSLPTQLITNSLTNNNKIFYVKSKTKEIHYSRKSKLGRPQSLCSSPINVIKHNFKNTNNNIKKQNIGFTNSLSSINTENPPHNSRQNKLLNVELNDITLNFNLLFNSSLNDDVTPIDDKDIYISAKSYISDSDSNSDSDSDSQANSENESETRESYEFINNLNCKSSIMEAQTKHILINNGIRNQYNHNNINEKGTNTNKNRGIFYNSINLLKESYDYLSSHNKSI
jgi:serine/threonine protein kinase